MQAAGVFRRNHRGPGYAPPNRFSNGEWDGR